MTRRPRGQNRPPRAPASNKRRVWRLAQDFSSRPWTIEVAGLVDRPGTYDVHALPETPRPGGAGVPMSMRRGVVDGGPRTGFPLARLLDEDGVRSGARYVRFVSFDRPAQAPGQHTQTWYPWPYHEGLRIDEARHDLTLPATGIFGHPLPNQHGAPVRLVVPWRYGYNGTGPGHRRPHPDPEAQRVRGDGRRPLPSRRPRRAHPPRMITRGLAHRPGTPPR